MARITGMNKLSDILQRIKSGASANSINKELGAHKTVIRRVRQLAEKYDWLSPMCVLPDDCVLAEKYRELFPSTLTPHPLDAFRDEIKSWQEAGDSFAVMLHKLHARMGNTSIKDTRLRDFVHKHFVSLTKPVIRRDAEPAVAEMDFGYLGKCKDECGVEKKTWFISVRFRYSRHAYREHLLHTNIHSVINALIRAFDYFGAVPERLVIDNFKAAVVKAHLYDPTLTQSFRDFAKHYGVIIDACKAGAPEHKGGVESDVKYVKRNYLPLLRYREKERGHDVVRLSSVNEYFREWDAAIADVRSIREAHNRKPCELFVEEMQYLKALPPEPHEITEYAAVRVYRDWHVRFDTVRYSVPYEYRMRNDAIIRANSLGIHVFIDNKLVAAHARSYTRGGKVTKKEHGPEASMEYLAQTRAYLLRHADHIGPNTHRIMSALLNDQVQCYLRSARGLMSLRKKYADEQIEAACGIAIDFDMKHYHDVKHILEQNIAVHTLEALSNANGQHFLFARSADAYTKLFKEQPWTHSHN
jgi:hypothetical protein